MLTLLLLVIILYIFRNELQRLLPHWRRIVTICAALCIGLFYAGFLQRFGAFAQAEQFTGIDRRLLVMVVVFFSLIAVARIIAPVIHSIFPPEDNTQDRHRR